MFPVGSWIDGLRLFCPGWLLSPTAMLSYSGGQSLPFGMSERTNLGRILRKNGFTCLYRVHTRPFCTSPFVIEAQNTCVN